MDNNLKFGIIGGSGLEDGSFFEGGKIKKIETPYGPPSSDLILSNTFENQIVFISRHGKNHSINPTNVNYKANIWSLKNEGCTHIIAATACGSLREKIEPGHFVFPDQFIDRTLKRDSTFFDKNEVVHTPMGEPFSKTIRENLILGSKNLGFKFHKSGTLVTIEGPRFSTKAESNLFRMWGADIINMSSVPEGPLARELKMEYQPIAMSTDYDCWREGEEEVSMDLIYTVMKKNVENIKKLLSFTISNFKDNF